MRVGFRGMEMGLDLQEAFVRPTHLLRLFVLAGLLPVLGACSEGTAPEEPLAPAYVLVTVDGAPELVLADHTTPSGVRQLYTMLYDSLSFESATVARRSLRGLAQSSDAFGQMVPVAENGFQYSGRVLRRGERVIVEYQGLQGSTVKPDTFTLRGTTLVKMGPYGVVCAACAPLRMVEYVYLPATTGP
jgi:hypothetical protein